ncbi:PIN domain-containing protein [candidate division KSB1 bacterium]|nr:PIN domain-containing protein [candidate division KSB1 bacterium]
MTNIFVDSDIILDLLLKREPYYLPAAHLFSLVEKRKIVACTTPVVMANIHYISARLTDKKLALDNIRKLLSLLKITPVDEKTLLLAIDFRFTDFEDAVQYYAAKSRGISCFITRNKSDYKVTDMTICTAAEYLKIYFQDMKE